MNSFFIIPRQPPLKDLLEIGIQVCDMLSKIHKAGRVHANINTDNILINPDTGRVRLRGETGAGNDSPSYMSPEQTGRTNLPVDYRTDLYSFGIVLYELLTGRLPFEASDLTELTHCHIAKTPVAPFELDSKAPKTLSDIVVKLLAKAQEDRYKSAYGLKKDLEQCLNRLYEGHIEAFDIAREDAAHTLNFPEKIYGRERERDLFMEVFDRVRSGTSEMALVTGAPGIGKSALIKETGRQIAKEGGCFVSGKFDQFNRAAPYSALLEALKEAIDRISGSAETELREWKKTASSALGKDAHRLITVLPELERLTGRQRPGRSQGSDITDAGFIRVLLRFIKSLARQNNPLVIFIDDMQWADLASLNVIKALAGDTDAKYLMLLGAYRDNEVRSGHLLKTVLSEIKTTTTYTSINLKPLDIESVNRLIAGSLACNPEISGPLAGLVFEKTLGNPFFVKQLLRHLYETGLLVFNNILNTWNWNPAAIKTEAITANVVELLQARLRKLPANTRALLQYASCIGCAFSLDLLAAAAEKEPQETGNTLEETLNKGFIVQNSEPLAKVF